LLTLALLGGASPASGSITLGQLAPGTSPPTTCPSPLAVDILQPTVTGGNPYYAKEAGTITSWSHNASADLGQSLYLKVYRQVLGSTYLVVGHDGPRTIFPNAVNTFSGFSIDVKPGDVIGLNDGPPSACAFSATGDEFQERMGNLADGTSGSFTPHMGLRANVTAVLNPTNTFTLGGVVRNKRRGSASVRATVPNPGFLSLTGKGVKAAGAGGASAAINIPSASTVTLQIRAAGKRKNTLSKRGKVKLQPAISFTPTGGSPSVQSLSVKLQKKD
jgi:hypothetical protein